MIERLDGFTAEGHGNVISGTPQPGDVIRIDGKIEQRVPAAPVSPQPNNNGNPYFGKRPIATKDFFAIAGQALGARYPRLRNDPAFLWVYDVISKVDIVDVDDRGGQFLRILGYLTTTNAQDSSPLMSAGDVTSIIAIWP